MLNKSILSISLLFVMCCAGIAFCDDEVALFQQPSAFVEAYVVQIPTEVLTEAGITIGQPPEKMSFTKVIWALLTNPEESTILSGGKSSIPNGAGCLVRSVHERCFGDSWIESGMSFNVESLMIQDRSAMVMYEYDLEETGSFDRKKDLPHKKFPDKTSHKWSGSIILQSGVPAIAAASQNEDTVTFLIFIATVQEPKGK